MDQCNMNLHLYVIRAQKEKVGRLFAEFVINMVSLFLWLHVLYLKFLSKRCILKRKYVCGSGGAFFEEESFSQCPGKAPFYRIRILEVNRILEIIQSNLL